MLQILIFGLHFNEKPHILLHFKRGNMSIYGTSLWKETSLGLFHREQEKQTLRSTDNTSFPAVRHHICHSVLSGEISTCPPPALHTGIAFTQAGSWICNTVKYQ